MRWRRRAACVLGGGALALAALAGLDAAVPPDLSRLSDLSVTVADRSGIPLRSFLNKEDSWRLPAKADDVPETFVALLLAYEDKRFFEHGGVDPLAVARAAGQNFAAGRVVSGASTLTMQVARLLEPKARTWSAKLVETARAIQLEWRYSKAEILGMYLTLAPYGGNLEGVRAASHALFAKSPASLTLPEAALLVALPRAPSQLRPDRFPERARAARDAVLDRAVLAGALSPRHAEEAKSEPIPAQRAPLPMLAPHLAEALRQERPGQYDIRSTLDAGLQRQVEGLARRLLPTLDERAGLAVLVADHRSRTVLAYVGAPDPLDHRRFGPVDMVRARRSPGSTLKPFAYGMGFADGVIHPETLLADVSTRFGDYAPRNFDRDFTGELTVREALQRSLNVPAVLVLDKIGPVRFVEALRRAGVALDLPRGTKAPGLPIILGGTATSLWELASLYAGLAEEGRVGPLRALADAETPAAVPVMTPEAARQTLRILEGAPPPSGIVQLAAVRQRGAIAVKTGTSFGFRDAWAFGVSGRFVVGVWVGRPDGTPSPGHYGRNTAAPLVYQVFDLLPADPAAPSGGLLAGIGAATLDTAPAALQRRIGAGAVDTASRPRLVFPTDGMTVDALDPAGGTVPPVTLEASGGRRPLSWLVDGRRMAVSPVRRDVQWHPDGPGFTRITVVDADGRSDSALVEIR